MEFVVRLTRIRSEPFSPDVVERHVERLRQLDDAGRLVAAGPLADGSGGLVIAIFDSEDDAETWAATEPFVIDGYETVDVRAWIPATRANGYLLDDG